MVRHLWILALSLFLLASSCHKEPKNPTPQGTPDAALTLLEVPTMAFQGQDLIIRGKIQNYGDAPIHSMDIVWQVDEGPEHVMELSGIDIGRYEMYDFRHTDPYEAVAGNHVLKVSIRNVNGQASDGNDSNNQIEAHLMIASQGVHRRVLYEEFTSSTCHPCADFNGNYFTYDYLQRNADKIAVIKYQMNWPGSGDPYYTREGGVRRQYYGVTAVPSLFMDGKGQRLVSTAGLQQALDNEARIPAMMQLEAYYTITSDSIVKVRVNGTSYVEGNFKLHVAVVERTTRGNVGGNGETEFHFVMMKMVPDASGTDIQTTINESFTKRMQASLHNTHVEEMDDLEVVVFVQYDENKYVLQSAKAVEDASQIDF